jgi:hypothetical protein
MRKLWGTFTEASDLGVVAERCPYCAQIVPCLVRSVLRGHYVLFVKVADDDAERSCLCTLCLQEFACEHWRYAALVQAREAKALRLEDLLARTNPGRVEFLQLKEQVRALGGDARFAIAYEQIDGMREGALRSKMMKQLLGWDRLTEEQRALLAQQIAALVRAWELARRIAPTFPGRSAGCFTVPLFALVVASAFLASPTVRSWLWGGVTVVAGCGAAALTSYLFLARRVREWTRKKLIPKAEDDHVSLACFLAVVDDLPGSRLDMLEELWPVKVHLKTIRAVLTAEGQL